MSEEEVKKDIVEGSAEFFKDPTDFSAAVKFMVGQYMNSMHFLKENTLENAKKLGYLDVHELYPDIPRYPFAKFAEEFYSLPNPGEEFNAYM